MRYLNKEYNIRESNYLDAGSGFQQHKKICTIDRHHFQVLSFELDSGGQFVWGVWASYTSGDDTITVTLEKGFDGINLIDNQDTGWSSLSPTMNRTGGQNRIFSR